MAQVVVRQIEEAVKQQLKRRAARNGRSMEEELRAILRAAAETTRRPPRRIGSAMAARFRGAGLVAPLPELRGERPRPVGFGR